MIRLALALAIIGACVPAIAADVMIAIENAWVRPADAGQASIPLYVDITSNVPLTLVGARSDIAGSAALLVTQPGGEREIAKVVTSVELTAGSKFRLAPRGPFVELRALAQAVRPGDSVPFTLEFTGADGKAVRASGDAVVRGTMPRANDYEIEASPAAAVPAAK